MCHKFIDFVIEQAFVFVGVVIWSILCGVAHFVFVLGGLLRDAMH